MTIMSRNGRIYSPCHAVEQVSIVLPVDPPLGQVQGRLALPQPRLQIRMKDDLFSKLPEHFDAVQGPQGFVL